MKKYTIEEVKEWLEGQILLGGIDMKSLKCPRNQAIIFLLEEMSDPEDGLEAVTDRLKARKNWSKD